MSTVILFLKAHVAGYMRGGRYVKPHDRKGGAAAQAAPGQLALFPAPLEPGQVPAGLDFSPPAAPADPRRKFYVTMIREPGPRQKVARLAGPFDQHQDALAHVDRAKAKANELDPWSEFDAFGTTAFTADEHKPGVLNGHLGIGAQAPRRDVQ